MKRNIYSVILSVSVLMGVCAVSSGQNLDPTVEVSRSYEGKLMEVHKPAIKMAVPDSVLRFDLEFDYSVSDSPYKGAYEFSPYAMEMKPAAKYHDVRKFYLKAGAGYSLHPELDVIWSPSFKKPFRLDVYASGRSYLGNYWDIVPRDEPDGSCSLGRIPKNGGESRYWKGYDILSKAGVAGRYDWGKARLGFDVAYGGIHQGNGVLTSARSYNVLDAEAYVGSKDSKDSSFGYYLSAAYRMGGDRLAFETSENLSVMTRDLDVDARMRFGFSNGDRLVLEAGFKAASTTGYLASGGGELDVVPHYMMDRGRWRFDIGARISPVFRNVVDAGAYSYEEQMLYPDVRIEYMALRDAMKLYLDLGGDSRMVTYGDLVGKDRRADFMYGRGVWNVLDVSDESLSVSLGADGRIGAHFSYDLKAGYSIMANALTEGLAVVDGVLAPAAGFSAYDKAFAAVSWLLDADSFRFDGNIRYTYAVFRNAESASGLFLPAALTGDVAMKYNWKKRLDVGLDCVFSTARKGSVLNGAADAFVPGYADLGLSAEFSLNRKFSIWVRGGNLIGMTIQRSLLYAEKGPYFTAGICLNL